MRHLARTEFLFARTWVLAVALGSAFPSAADEQPGQRSSTREFDEELRSALAARDFESASRACDELIERKSSTMEPVDLAGFLGELAEIFYATETPRGAGQAESLFARALTILEEARGLTGTWPSPSATWV